MVTTPEPTAVTDAYATIKTICRCQEHGDLNLLVNMAAHQVEAERVARRICAVAKQFLSVYLEVPGYIVNDEHVRAAVNLRRPLLLAFPEAQASFCIQRVARNISKEPDRTPKARGFFARVMDVLAGRRGGRAAG